MRQEGKDPEALRDSWEAALHKGWADAGLTAPDYELDMPFYGKELDRLTRDLRRDGGAVVRGEVARAISEDEEAMLREYALLLQISDEDVDDELGPQVVDRGAENWEVVQALARLIERRVPRLGTFTLSLVHQVDAYLNRDHIKKAVDAIVRPLLTPDPAVIVAHSLGTVVTYSLLTELGVDAKVPLLVTAGSPLGLKTVTARLQPPPLARPAGVGRWVNATDDRDCVALYANLDASCFASGIENFSDLRNRPDDPHSIIDYLAQRPIAKSVFAALTA